MQTVVIGEERCERCKFCKGTVDGAGQNKLMCNRYPPSVHMMVGPGGKIIVNSTSPFVAPQAWCGEFKARLLLATDALDTEGGKPN